MQTLGRQGRAGKPPIARRKNLRDLFRLEPLPADLNEGAGNRANHVLKKPIAADPEDPGFIGSLPACIEDGSDSILDFGSRRAKRSEIMRAQEHFGSAIHHDLVQWITKA
jgi:hypothetical protein